MSEKLVSHVAERVCDVCGKTEQFNLIQPTPEEIARDEKWFFVGRKVYDYEHAQFMPCYVQVCSIDCVPAAGVKLLAINSNGPSEPGPSGIDLSTLQSN